MEELLAAIRSRYTGAPGAAARAVLNGLFAGIGEAGTDFPFATYNVITGLASDTMDSTFEHPLIQFTVFDNSPSPLLGLQGMELLKALYKDELLTLVTWTVVRAQLEITSELPWNEADENWSEAFSIRYMIEKAT